MLELYCLGAQGTFSHQAALHMKSDLETVRFAPDLLAVIEPVIQGGNSAIVPIENTTTGLIRPIVDAILDSGLIITQEFNLPIEHHLIRMRGASCESINTVYAQREAHDQCLEALAPYRDFMVLTSSSYSALEALRKDKNACSLALVGPELLYEPDVELYKSNVQTYINNQTRFVRVSKQTVTEFCKGTMMISFTLKHSVGSLATALNFFAHHGVNIRSIHSRPLPHHIGCYRFYLELIVPNEDSAIFLTRQHPNYLESLSFLGVVLNS